MSFNLDNLHCIHRDYCNAYERSCYNDCHQYVPEIMHNFFKNFLENKNRSRKQ